MLMVKELEKVYLGKEYTPDGSLSKEERKNKSLENLKTITKDLMKQEELVELLKEFQNQETKEAKFVNCVSKIESDLQAKIYDLKGEFSLENALEDVKNFGSELAAEILPKMKNASDGWIEYDRKQYIGNEIFESLSQEIQKLDTIE